MATVIERGDGLWSREEQRALAVRNVGEIDLWVHRNGERFFVAIPIHELDVLRAVATTGGDVEVTVTVDQKLTGG